HPDGSPGGGTYSCSTVPSGVPTSGVHCFLCLLNNLPNPTAATTVLSLPNRAVTINGEIDSNGTIVGSGAGSKLSGNPVKLYTGATCTICSSPPTYSMSAFP